MFIEKYVEIFAYPLLFRLFWKWYEIILKIGWEKWNAFSKPWRTGKKVHNCAHHLHSMSSSSNFDLHKRRNLFVLFFDNYTSVQHDVEPISFFINDILSCVFGVQNNEIFSFTRNSYDYDLLSQNSFTADVIFSAKCSSVKKYTVYKSKYRNHHYIELYEDLVPWKKSIIFFLCELPALSTN